MEKFSSQPGKHQDVKPLCPVSSSVSSFASSTSLFPVTNDAANNVATTDEGELDWLENKSFLPTSLILAQEDAAQQKSPAYDSVHKLHSVARDAGSGAASPAGESTRILPTGVTAQKRNWLTSDSSEEELSAHNTKSHGDSKKKKKKKHKKRKKKGKQKDYRSSGPGQEAKDSKFGMPTDVLKNYASRIFIEEVPGLTPEFAFRLDRKCEKSLWNYESVYTNHIARYRRLMDSCIGNTDIKLTGKKDRGKDSFCRYYAKEKRKALRMKGQSVRAEQHPENQVPCYISLKEKSSEDGRSTLSRKNTEPLGVADSAKNVPLQGSVPDEKEKDELVSDELFEKTAYYNRRLQHDSSNVKLWVEFVHFQDQVFQDARFSAKSTDSKRIQDSFQSPRGCIEKKLAILEKALEANPSSLELKLLKLEVEQDVCDSKTQAKEWDKLLFVHAADVQLWRHYLTFKQSHLASFTVGHTIKLYHRFFRTLVPILDKKVKVVNVPADLEDSMIGVFEQYCNFLHQSGHTEKAVGSYQALIEFNLFRPPALNLTATQDCVMLFESFWDSGVARFGEPGARGWAAWMDGSRPTNSTHVAHGLTDEQQEEILNEDLPKYKTWLKIEQLRQDAHRLPWRPDIRKGESEDDCEDLDRMVLYDDVAPVLFCLCQSHSYSRLVQSFVSLLGQVQRQICAKDDVKFDQLRLDAVHQIGAPSALKENASGDSTTQLSDNVVWFLEEVLRQAAAYFTDWHQSVLSCQLLRLQTEKHNCEDSTGLSERAVKEARKFGKSLLKELQNRNDLLLWNAYIRQDWAFGKKKDALSMLQTALAMFSTNSSSDNHTAMAGLCSLYCTWAELHLHFSPLELVELIGRRKATPSVEDKNKVVNSFVCLMDLAEFHAAKVVAVPAAAQILRTRNKFQQKVAGLISDAVNVSPGPSVKEHIVQLVTCFALFELCATGISESLQVFDRACYLCTEACQQADISNQVRMLYHGLEMDLCHNLVSLLQNYMSVNVVPVNQLRARLETVLCRFPDNPAFLGQMVAVESRNFMAGRLRHFFTLATREPASVYPVIFEVLAEISRHTRLLAASTKQVFGQAEGFTDSGTLHRVRAACERGLRHTLTQHCPLLWRLYFKFEAKYGSSDRAKGILYRALQACPWAKVLYLDGVEQFGEEQLQELVDLMTEKEIRLQIPLEEVELLLASEPQPAEENTQPI